MRDCRSVCRYYTPFESGLVVMSNPDSKSPIRKPNANRPPNNSSSKARPRTPPLSPEPAEVSASDMHGTKTASQPEPPPQGPLPHNPGQLPPWCYEGENIAVLKSCVESLEALLSDAHVQHMRRNAEIDGVDGIKGAAGKETMALKQVEQIVKEMTKLVDALDLVELNLSR